MQSSLRRVAAASIPLALLASSALASDAKTIMRPVQMTVTAPLAGPFARPFAVSSAFYGGGATLPIVGYLGGSLSSGTAGVAASGNGSVFGFWETSAGGSAPKTQYCATGSGKGKGVFTGPAGTVKNLCSNASTGSGTVGFAASAGQITQSYPNFAGSDAPLSQSDYSAFLGNNPAPREPVELPSIIGSIAMYYTNSSISQSTHAALSDADICGIVLGRITNWSQLSGHYPAKPLTLVYRSDGSGTTFNFSNHLSAVCGSTAITTSQQFTVSSPAAPPYVVNSVPAGAIGAKGNGGVVSAIAAKDGAIGYAEAANILKNLTGGSNYALVRGFDPVKNLPEAANSLRYSSGTVAPNSAVVVTQGHPAMTAPLTGVRGGTCVLLVKPQGYAVPLAGYPIIAVTYLLFSSNGNGSNSAPLRSLINDLNTPADFGPAPRIATVNVATQAAGTGTTGYSGLGSTFNSQLKSTASSCIGA